MSSRLASGLVVSALIRRANQAGGFATLLARGDADAGAVLVVTLQNGDARAWERGIGAGGKTQLLPVGPQDIAGEADVTDYWRRRRAQDPDLWVLELNIASAQRFAAETILDD